MIAAEAFASMDMALIFPFIFLRSRNTRERLPMASERLPPDLPLSGHEDLLDVDFRRSRGGGARRRVRGAPEEDVGRPERQNCDGPDDDQLPVHETTAFQTPTRARRDLDIAIVKVRLIESIELTINV